MISATKVTWQVVTTFNLCRNTSKVAFPFYRVVDHHTTEVIQTGTDIRLDIITNLKNSKGTILATKKSGFHQKMTVYKNQHDKETNLV